MERCSWQKPCSFLIHKTEIWRTYLESFPDNIQPLISRACWLLLSYLRNPGGFLLKFLYGPFYLSQETSPVKAGIINDCTGYTSVPKEKNKDNSIICNSPDQWVEVDTNDSQDWVSISVFQVESGTHFITPFIFHNLHSRNNCLKYAQK